MHLATIDTFVRKLQNAMSRLPPWQPGVVQVRIDDFHFQIVKYHIGGAGGPLHHAWELVSYDGVPTGIHCDVRLL